MDITGITQLIGSVGFPIAAYLLIYVQMLKQDEQHRQEMDEMRKAVDACTAALTELKTIIRGEYRYGKAE